MRNTLLLIFALLFIFSSCKKENEEPEYQEPEIPNQTTPEKVQWGFALYYTATW
jgi:hypothetical protein